MFLFSVVLLLCASFMPSEGLLNHIAVPEPYVKHMLLDMQRNITLLQQAMIARDVNQTQTMKSQQMKIEELEIQNRENNRTITEQQRKIEDFEKQGIQQSQVVKEIEERLNQNVSAYKTILQDIVDRQDKHVNEHNNQTHSLNQSITDLGKQLQYLTLSLLDMEKRTTRLNTSMNGKCSRIICDELCEG